MHLEQAYAHTIGEVIKKAETDRERGLSQQEAKRRRKEYGPNELPTGDRDSYLFIFLRQFQDPLIYILLAAAIGMVFLADLIDAFVISVVVIFNAVVGTLLEGRAQNVLAHLKRVAAGTCSVKRDGEHYNIRVQELVVGDVVILKKGDSVPADARIIANDHLVVDESILTGESAYVEKHTKQLESDTALFDRKNMVFKGTAVVKGEAVVVVTATGLDTQVGSMHETIAQIETEMPLQKSLDRLSYGILYALAGVVLLMFGIGVLWGKPLQKLFLTLVALFIAAIPEGLPVVLTVVLAMGTQRMLRRNVLVKRLQAVGGLGRVSVLIIDKTGTLTRNEMMVTDVYADRLYTVDGEGYEPEGTVRIDDTSISAPVENEQLKRLAHAAILLNDSDIEKDPKRDRYVIHGDPTEAAMVVFGRRLGYKEEDLAYTQIFEIPYSDEYQMHFGVYQKDGDTHVFIAGAPEVLIERSQDVSDALKKELDRMLEDGLRVIGVGYYHPPHPEQVDDWHTYITQEVLGKVTMLGLCGMRDPVRTEAADMVVAARNAGYDVVMATGDHQGTAEHVARETKILQEGYQLVTGKELDNVLNDPERWEKTKAFARVTPDDKYTLLDAYHKQGKLVAMTGDGVNDVPALAAADVSIAMGQSGTDIAQKAADIVLLDDSFKNIVDAIREARHIFYTLRRVVLYFLTTNGAEVMIIFLTVLLNLKLPVYPIQLLWLNFVSDGFLDIGLAFEPREEGILEQHWLRRAQQRGLFDWQFVGTIIYMAIPMAIGALSVFHWYLPELDKARTMGLVTLTVFQWMNGWNCGSETKSILQLSPISNPWLILATLIVVAIQCAILYVPFLQMTFKTVGISLADWGYAVAIASFILLYDEARKYVVRQRRD